MKEKSINKNNSLQALRGMAALMVFFSHALSVFPLQIPNNNFNRTIHFFYAGDIGVVIFFVMSGYFMFFSLKTFSIRNYFEFVLKKLVRIFPVYIVVMIGAFLLCNWNIIYNKELFSEWFASFWNIQVDLSDLFWQLTIIGNKLPNLLNPPVWTMGIEVKMLLFVPLFMFLVKSCKPWFTYAISLICSYFLGNVLCIPFLPIDVLVIFVTGYLLSSNIEWIKTKIKSLPKYGIVLLFIFGFFLMDFKNLFPEISQQLPDVCRNVIVSIGVSLWIGILANKIISSKNIVEKILVFFGNISYSFYLCHFVILLAMRPYFDIINNSAGFIIIGFFLTIVISFLFYFVIEKKFGDILKGVVFFMLGKIKL